MDGQTLPIFFAVDKKSYLTISWRILTGLYEYTYGYGMYVVWPEIQGSCVCKIIEGEKL